MDFLGNGIINIVWFIIPTILWLILFLSTKSRIKKVKHTCTMLFSLSLLTAYLIAKRPVIDSEIKSAAMILSLGLISTVSLIIVCAIELKNKYRKEL